MCQIRKISVVPVSGVVGYSRLAEERAVACRISGRAILSSKAATARLSQRHRGSEFIRFVNAIRDRCRSP
jgi:hypothetical protein